MNTNSGLKKIKNIRYNNQLEKRKIASYFLLKKINTQKKIMSNKDSNTFINPKNNNNNFFKMKTFETSYDFGIRNKKIKNIKKKDKIGNLSYSFLTKKNIKPKINERRKN